MLLAIGLTTLCYISTTCELSILVCAPSSNLACRKCFVTHTILGCKIFVHVVIADLITIRAEAVTWTSELLHIRPIVEFHSARKRYGTSTPINRLPTILVWVLFIWELSRKQLVTNRARCNQRHCGKKDSEKKQSIHLSTKADKRSKSTGMQ